MIFLIKIDVMMRDFYFIFFYYDTFFSKVPNFQNTILFLKTLSLFWYNFRHGLEDMDSKKNITLECDCVFHYTCIKKWFRLKKVCPTCETPVELK